MRVFAVLKISFLNLSYTHNCNIKAGRDEISGKIILPSEIILLVFLYKEVRYLLEIGIRSYISGFWCWIELIIVITLFSGIVLWAVRWYYEDKSMLLLRKGSHRFIILQYAGAADEMLKITVSILLFFSTLKVAEYSSHDCCP